LIKERQEITKQQQARIQAAKAAVPDDAYDLPIMTLGLPTKIENLLDEADFSNVGELAYRLLLVPDMINDIDGIGPTSIKQIESALEVMIGYEPLPEEYDIVEEIILDEEPTGQEEEPEQVGEEEAPVGEEGASEPEELPVEEESEAEGSETEEPAAEDAEPVEDPPEEDEVEVDDANEPDLPEDQETEAEVEPKETEDQEEITSEDEIKEEE